MQGQQKVSSFQFHKGTIKPTPNPTKEEIDARFNSIKVRLNRAVLRGDAVEQTGFQFHKGTIKPH